MSAVGDARKRIGVEHVPGCNIGCDDDMHRLLGDDTEAWSQAIVFGTADFAGFKAWLAARERAAAEKALRDAADEMEAVIADGDVAEVAAHVEGEVNRGRVVDRRDALYEEPHTWLREWVNRIARSQP